MILIDMILKEGSSSDIEHLARGLMEQNLQGAERIEALGAAIRKHKENCDRIIGECETDSSRHVRAWIEHGKLWSILDAPGD